MPLGAEIGPGQCQPMGAALGGAEWGVLVVQEQRTPTAGTAPLAGCKEGVPWGWGLCRDGAQGPTPSSSCGWRGAPILAPPPRALSPAKLGPSGGQGSGGPAPHPCIVSLHPRAPLLDSPPWWGAVGRGLGVTPPFLRWPCPSVAGGSGGGTPAVGTPLGWQWGGVAPSPSPPRLCPQVGSWEQGCGCWVTPLRVCACVSPPYLHPSADPCPGSGQWGPQGAARHGGGGIWALWDPAPCWGGLEGPWGPAPHGVGGAARSLWGARAVPSTAWELAPAAEAPPLQGWRGGKPNSPPRLPHRLMCF